MMVHRSGRLPRRRFFERLRRNAYFHLLIPLKRSRRPPEYGARGIAIGLALGLTPTDGFQLILLGAIWFAATRLAGWQFSWLIAAAWTTVTNPLTIPLIYFAFHATGAAILGQALALDYGAFAARLAVALPEAGGFGAQTVAYATILLRDFGLVMLLGSLPYAVLGGATGYVLGLRFIRRYRARKAT